MEYVWIGTGAVLIIIAGIMLLGKKKEKLVPMEIDDETKQKINQMNMMASSNAVVAPKVETEIKTDIDPALTAPFGDSAASTLQDNVDPSLFQPLGDTPVVPSNENVSVSTEEIIVDEPVTPQPIDPSLMQPLEETKQPDDEILQ